MHLSSIQRILALACLGSLPALANPPYNPNEPPPPTLVPPKPTPSGVPKGDCCGYLVSSRDNAWFRYSHEIDFDQLSSLDQVFEAGWEISHGWQVGPQNPSTGRKAIADENNIELIKGQGLRLKVPRQDKSVRSFSVAELIFPDIILGGVIKVEMQLTGVPGTVMSFMTTHADNTLDSGSLGWKDAQSIELLGNSLLKSTGVQPVGINMVTYDSKTEARSATSHTFPAGVNPTTGFHTYSMSWFPSTSSFNPSKLTEMRFDGNPLNSPKAYASVNPAVVTFSHWTNADINWSGLPPTQDAYLTIKRVVAYYDRPIKMATGTGVSRGTCKKEKACQVAF